MAENFLPTPPDDHQLRSYLGPQRRWLFLWSTISILSIGWSVTHFAYHAGIYYLLPWVIIFLAFSVSIRSSTRRRRIRDWDAHQVTVDHYHPDVIPSVDVFLPTAGEPLDVLDNTYWHVNAMAWNGTLTVRVLDDADRPEVAELAHSYGFDYSVRANRPYMKKAGNLAHGFTRSSSDFIAIFDADFVPRSDYLEHLMPYFADDHVGIVQSPQYFDTVTGMGWLQRCAGATQELFYRFIQPSRDAVGAAICVGSCAIYRRTALVKAGGFAQIGHSEDVHTGVKVLKAGDQVRYVPVNVSKGICPDNLSGFLNQQYRWCLGSMSLLKDRSFHQTSALTIRQRLCFWSGFGYFISTGVSVLFGFLPSMAMIWFYPQLVKPLNLVWMIPAVLTWLVIMPLVITKQWRFDVLRVQMLYSFSHALAILHILTGRTRDWVATGTRTGGTSISTSVRRLYRLWLGAILLLTWPRLIEETAHYGLGRYWAMLVLGGLALFIQIPVLTLTDKAVDPGDAAAVNPDEAVGLAGLHLVDDKETLPA